MWYYEDIELTEEDSAKFGLCQYIRLSEPADQEFPRLKRSHLMLFHPFVQAVHDSRQSF